MITVRLKIGDGLIYDTQEHGFVYVSADSIFAAPVKDFETTAYPEQEGENLLPKTVDEAFDYKVKFYVKAEGSLENANEKIAAFNAKLYTQSGDTKTFKQVTFYNDYKRVRIVGYPKPISEATDFWRDSKGNTHDVVTVEWTIRVNQPSLCDFNSTPPQMIATYNIGNFESGEIPNRISGNDGALRIVANPYRSASNGSSRVLVDDMADVTWSTSGLIQITQLSAQEHSCQSFRLKLYQGINTYFPYCTLLAGNSTGLRLPKRINGGEIVGDGDAELYSSLLRKDDWNEIEYTAESFGLENFDSVTAIHFRPYSVWGGGNAPAELSDTNTRIVYLDDISLIQYKA